MKISILVITPFLLVLPLLAAAAPDTSTANGNAASGANRAPASFSTQVFSLNANGATAESVVRMIGTRAGLGVQIEGDLSKRVSYSFANTTLENAMQQMAGEVGFDYQVRDNTLYVTKRSSDHSTSGMPAHLIELKYVDADDMGGKLKGYLGTSADIHVDKKLNSLVMVGSDATFDRAMKFVELFDRKPLQILIEAKIVEANETFSREIGAIIQNATGTSYSNPASTGVTPQMNLKFSGLTHRNLNLQLQAAESNGDAKVVSRPKVVAINNTRALINSGITLNVKTLSTVQTQQGTTSGTTTPTGNVAGGLEQLQAGLQLGVLPSVMDGNEVRLVVDVNNSQPDSQFTVDGVPGISTNAANTSVIVENGATAVIAGLIRNADSRGRTGVPILKDIPILGFLFSSSGVTRRDDEMMIFITPHILDEAKGVKQARVDAEAELPKDLPPTLKEKAEKEKKK
jgi:type II secretory pathway component GspD/PulD (secretin)